MKQIPPELGQVLRRPSQLVRAVRAPIQSFIHTEQTGAAVLLAAAAAALVWVNSPWADSYDDLWHTHIALHIPIFSISEDLRHLVNDGLMAIFFFVVGLEIKRELVHGELSSFRKAALPVVAAIGGMATPALIYLAFNASTAGANGWGAPMATDIAFALGVLGLLGKRVPPELRVFLLGLAVVDDLGAIAVIAVFYTQSIDWAELGLAIALFAVIALCIRIGIRSLGFYLILCVLMWQFILESGIHATLAGVMVAALIPSRPYIRREDYAAAVEDLVPRFKDALARDDYHSAQAMAERIEKLSRGTEGPMERITGIVHPWVSFLILPLFALANAGVVFTSETLSEALGSRITLGMAAGLLIGNPIGILTMTWLAVKLGIGSLPAGVRWRHVLGVGMMAGIGFTVAIFVSGIAFDDPALENQAKMGIFGASVIAGVAGYVWLFFTGARAPGPELEGGAP